MMTKRFFAILICLACVLSTCLVSASAETGDVIRGDVNGDGQRTAIDYFVLKRYVLGTHVLSDSALLAADADGDGKVNGKDYMLVKRVILGSYTLDEPPAEAPEEELSATITLSIALKDAAGKELAVLENVLPYDETLLDRVLEEYFASNPEISEGDIAAVLENEQAVREITKMLLQAYIDALDTEPNA